jgi:hypothetical protein
MAGDEAICHGVSSASETMHAINADVLAFIGYAPRFR